MRRTPPKQERFQLLVARKRRNLRLVDLAELVGHDVSVVSKAINHGRYPRVLSKIREVLNG